MALNSEINRIALYGWFPKLQSDCHFEILSKATPEYNCIAWAMGYTDRWVDTYNAPGRWWPNGVKRNGKIDSLVSAFEQQGFVRCYDAHFEEGYDKVVLYGANGLWTHASRIVSEESEHSKFGNTWDGTHGHNMFHGTEYGDAFAYMKRPKQRTPDKTPKGTIKVLKKPVW